MSSSLARLSIVVGALTLLLAAGGCGGGASDRPPNLLLITLDTTRPDHLGCYGATDAETPQLDRIASEGVLFEQAFTVVPVTLPAHVSMFTGQYPPRHGVRLNGDFRLPEEGTTLAEHLASQGYSTAGVVGAYVLSADFGIGQGFGAFDEPGSDEAGGPGGAKLAYREIVERPAGEITDAALALLRGDGEREALREPFFLWLHYYDPHGEYDPPEPFAGRFPDRAYDGEIAYADAEIGRLLDSLRSSGVLDRTLLAVTADHGESLGEHGENTHGLLTYDSTLHVPLALRLPDAIPAGARSDRLVSVVDLAPTLLDLLGQPPMATAADGIDFAAAARGEAMEPREPLYAESELSLRSYGWAGLYALRDQRRKFIRGAQLELYDVEADPQESSNRAFQALGDVGDWTQRLGKMELRWSETSPSAAMPADRQTREKLAALGYVSGATTPPERAERPNPRTFVQLHNLLLDAQSLIAQGAFPQALELANKALEFDADNPTALELSGTLLCSSGRCDQGIERLQRAAHLSPKSYQTQRNLANALHLAGRLGEAAEGYRAAIALHPFSSEAQYALGNVLFAGGDVEGAVQAYREAARRGLSSAPFDAAFGVALAAQGDGDGARDALSRAVAADPGLADAWNQLGVLAERAGELEPARENYAHALEVEPAHAAALFNHAKLCLRTGKVERADADVARLLAAHPNYPAGRFLEAQLRLAQGNEAAARTAIERFLAQADNDPRLVQSARDLLGQLGG